MDSKPLEGRDARVPFFIIGAQRSGTTMLRLMMNAHPEICVPFESRFIPEFYRRLSEYGPLDNDENISRLLSDICENDFVVRGELIPSLEAVLARAPSSYAELVDAIFSTFAASQGKIFWGDKTPSYLTEVDTLIALFPRARVIHLVRDGRDVALSLRRLSWGSDNLPEIARDWRWRTFTAHKMGRMLGSAFLEVRYENLVADPSAQLERICEFVSVPYHPGMLDYASRASAAMPNASLAWHRNSVQPPMASKAQAWRRDMSKADQVIFGREAEESLKLFDYPPSPSIDTSKDRLKVRLRSLRYALRDRA